jgi:hypothetical protein
LTDEPEVRVSEVRREAFRDAVSTMSIAQLLSLSKVLERRPKLFVDELFVIQQRVSQLSKLKP